MGGGRIHSIREYSIPLRTKCSLTFEEVITKDALYGAWNDFIRGKRSRVDANETALSLADTIDSLYLELKDNTYTHGSYEAYTIIDPKKRVIHKASVRDRIVHCLLYNALYPYFNEHFIHDSYSCRVGKGTHRARARFRRFVNKVSANYTKPCYVLKFDIKKCFANIDQVVLIQLLHAHIADSKLLSLCVTVIGSFEKGLPLGNLTSQLFINLYLHELDHFVKHKFGLMYYLRYADDVVLVHGSRSELQKCFIAMNCFLKKRLHLTAHKVIIQSVYAGVDVLGEVFFEKYVRLRRSTERRAKKRLIAKNM